MRNQFVIAMGAFALAGCSQVSEEKAQAEMDDIKTVARLAGLDLNASSTNPADRAVRLAECSAVLTSHVDQTPPPERADQQRAAADRLQKAAIALGEANGKPAADLDRVRSEAIAAQGRLSAKNTKVYAETIAPAVKSCGLAEVMTDGELAGSTSSIAPADLGPMTLDPGTAPTN